MISIFFLFLLSLIYSLRSYLVLGPDILESKIALIFLAISFISFFLLVFRLGKILFRVDR